MNIKKREELKDVLIYKFKEKYGDQAYPPSREADSLRRSTHASPPRSIALSNPRTRPSSLCAFFCLSRSFVQYGALRLGVQGSPGKREDTTPRRAGPTRRR